MIPTPFRRALLSGACALLLAGCGGDDESQAVAKSAAPAAPAADSAGPLFAGPAAPPALPADSAAPQAAAPAPNAAAARARDSATADAILKAPVTGPVNVQVLANYQLTMDGLRKLVRAGQNLGELQARRPELRDSMRLEAFDPNGIYEKLNSIPDVRDAIAKAGLTPREYATATAALMQAAMVRQMRAQGMQAPPQVNEGNVRFVEENWAEIQQMMQAAAAQARPRP
ncbi:MAG TPA: hypothetical protein VLK84_17480 [Longimicrobium sp.]|nr:hypothetical protein [Longimicrobium sp.]